MACLQGFFFDFVFLPGTNVGVGNLEVMSQMVSWLEA
jgi:hypothetical protein